MLGLIALNLARNRGRTLFTAGGIAISVATIVALLSLAQGLKQSVGGLSNLGGASFGVFQGGVSDLTASVLPDSLVAGIRRLPGVEDAAPILLIADALPDSPSAIVFGADPNSFPARRLVITEGRRARGDEAMVGDELARRLGLGPGDPIVLKGEELPVVGVYHAGIGFEDEGVGVPTAAAERLSGRPNGVSTIAVNVEPDAATNAVAARVRSEFPGTLTIANPGEAARANPSFEIVNKAVLVIVVLALVLGAVAVTNTIAMAVLERQHELALMAAIGWSPGQVASVVIGEGAAVGLAGASLGLALGVGVSRLIVSLLSAGELVNPVVTAWGLGRGFLIGLAIGLLGGVYPAWRVSRQPPAELLGRY